MIIIGVTVGELAGWWESEIWVKGRLAYDDGGVGAAILKYVLIYLEDCNMGMKAGGSKSICNY